MLGIKVISKMELPEKALQVYPVIRMNTFFMKAEKGAPK